MNSVLEAIKRADFSAPELREMVKLLSVMTHQDLSNMTNDDDFKENEVKLSVILIHERYRVKNGLSISECKCREFFEFLSDKS